MRRDTRTKGKGRELHRSRLDESEELVHTSGGAYWNADGPLPLCNHRFCIQVSKEKKGKVVDARCRDLTNSAVCERGRAHPGSVELCDWHEVSLFPS